FPLCRRACPRGAVCQRQAPAECERSEPRPPGPFAPEVLRFAESEELPQRSAQFETPGRSGKTRSRRAGASDIFPAAGGAEGNLPQRDPLDYAGAGGTAALDLSAEPAFLPTLWSRLLFRLQPAEPEVLKDPVRARR